MFVVHASLAIMIPRIVWLHFISTSTSTCLFPLLPHDPIKTTSKSQNVFEHKNRSTSVTEDHMSNAMTEDDMSSGQTTDVSRTSSYQGQGSFEESLLAAQQIYGSHFHQHLSGSIPGASAAAAAAMGGGARAGAGAVGVSVPGEGGELSSLAEHLARAEDKVGRDYEKGLLYRQGPEGVAAAVAGEEMPIPASVAAAVSGGGGGVAMGAGGSRAGAGEEVESLADMLAQADDGPGNLKELFQRVSWVVGIGGVGVLFFVLFFVSVNDLVVMPLLLPFTVVHVQGG